MELTDRFNVAAPAADVWGLFWDLPRLAKCLPGCEKIEAVDETNYKARIVQRVGPFQVGMDLDLEIQEVAPEERVVVAGGGKDRIGNRLKLNRLALELAPVSEQETTVSYAMDFNLYGKLATLGNSVVKRKAEEVRVEFTRCITAEMESAK